MNPTTDPLDTTSTVENADNIVLGSQTMTAGGHNVNFIPTKDTVSTPARQSYSTYNANTAEQNQQGAVAAAGGTPCAAGGTPCAAVIDKNSATTKEGTSATSFLASHLPHLPDLRTAAHTVAIRAGHLVGFIRQSATKMASSATRGFTRKQLPPPSATSAAGDTMTNPSDDPPHNSAETLLASNPEDLEDHDCGTKDCGEKGGSAAATAAAAAGKAGSCCDAAAVQKNAVALQDLGPLKKGTHSALPSAAKADTAALQVPAGGLSRQREGPDHKRPKALQAVD
ncbi:hypothetical protein CEUSTIGMA_g7407.t1 [Chlamydomonas eustigma]|uniref:Uncharacterized protein n=1 Tax=Chlamydomonas eustigma TaxID=1157962 RepID=A0A250XA61_9CHLO|nr:hypothetical protein CEUSTIGMA_g7407.t1 [Chlamydomonas eustigma]|eukprot:GAX79968.1 hypothetical protein CEUSTIGMA_g7407.t1 [Chlamydomonas eustigma]